MGDRRTANSLTTMGMRCASEGRDDEAMDMFRRAVSADPDAADAWFSLGVLYCDRHMIGESIVAHRQAAIAQPENAFYWYALGTTYQTFQPRRWRQEAKAAFREALRHQPEYAEASLALRSNRDASVLRRILTLGGRMCESMRR